MNLKLIKLSIFSLLLSLFLFNLSPVLAQETSLLKTEQGPMEILQDVAAGDYGPYSSTTNENSLTAVVGLVINTALSLLGVIFIILMVLAGYNWMTASGSQEKVQEAQDTIKRAIIGLVIVIGSWAIWNFILENLIANL
ncbi:MAG: pilin [Patescibacteria group bacterium]|nr:pilin [Patescibacteria group bacterium]